MKQLADILAITEVLETHGPSNPEINDIIFDSRSAMPNDMFIAVRGTQVDGHDYIRQATDNGVVAVACETLPGKLLPGITYIKLENSSQALGTIASAYYDYPSSNIKIIGVGGTNGKTTIVTSLYRLFSRLGYPVAMLSTIRNMVLDKELTATHTTPDAISINKLLKIATDQGCEYCFMEISSHALAQDRVSGLDFAGGIFTNITHDHLDYHGSFKDYLDTKKKFYDQLGQDSFVLTNIDDRNGRIMVQNTAATVFTYALKKSADFKGKILESQLEGLQLLINGQELFSQVIGHFNAYNLLAVYGTALSLGQNQEEVLAALSNLKAVEGRFEYMRGPDNITGIIDYAHTPDALKNVLDTIGSIRTRNEKLITVVGAGGDRDIEKRPLMAMICAAKSDQVILTSDNPRSEDPQEIINEMKKGVSPELQRKVLSIVNRREAIKTACALARANDIILIAGKGHEKYQEIKGVKYPFDDKEVLSQELYGSNSKN